MAQNFSDLQKAGPNFLKFFRKKLHIIMKFNPFDVK